MTGTIPWDRPRVNDSSSVPNGTGITEAPVNATTLRPTRHLPELRSPHPVHDIHDRLDRATAEGLPNGYKNARHYAQRGVGTAADG